MRCHGAGRRPMTCEHATPHHRQSRTRSHHPIPYLPMGRVGSCVRCVGAGGGLALLPFIAMNEGCVRRGENPSVWQCQWLPTSPQLFGEQEAGRKGPLHDRTLPIPIPALQLHDHAAEHSNAQLSCHQILHLVAGSVHLRVGPHSRRSHRTKSTSQHAGWAARRQGSSATGRK